MKHNTMTNSYPEIIVPVKQGILKIPLNSPCIQIIDKHTLEKNEKIDWQQLVSSKKVLIFLEEIFSLATVVEQLLNHGENDKMKISIHGVVAPNSKQILNGRLVDIEQIRLEKKMMQIEMIIVGDLHLFAQNGYFKRKPLWGKKIVTTRPKLQAYQLVRDLENLGADVIQFPLVVLKSSTDYDEMQDVLERIEAYQWIIFGMNMSVDYFIAFLLGSGYNLNCLKNSKICALSLESGERLAELGIDIHYLPASFRLDLDKVVDGLRKCGINKDQPILVLAAEKRGRLLSEKMIDLNMEVTFIPILRAEWTEIDKEKIDKLMDCFPIDLWIFNEPFGVRWFGQIWKKINGLLEKSIIAAIGPQTQEALEKEGIAVDIMPRELTIPSLIETIIDYYDNQENDNLE